ncbi:unnamed protein product [Adineta steineri]|uniref:Uncharacterized protein n=1 Tax=Adineta steineri TaxID=433720 RepID=A0A814AZP3_9BILA|nr:unnamed protein product [Adineta steineri]CAF0919587.1 unnamed protein product [Adineta steineri]
MIINQFISFLFIILLISTGLNTDDIDSSDDDDNSLMRLRRQVKKFAYADPCEIECVTKQIRTKIPIKILAKKCKDQCKDTKKFKPAIYY